MVSHPNFDSTTTATEVAKVFADNVRGKTVLITGCSPNNIGFATAQAVATADVGLLIISGRSSSKLDKVADTLLATTPNLNLRRLIMDLSSQQSVKTAAKEVNAYQENIDVLVNCAGVMAYPRRELTEDGIELTFAANHIGHWLFTNLILEKLRSAAASSQRKGRTRIINVSSAGHMYSPVRFSDYNFSSGKPVPADESPNWERLTWRGSKETLDYEPMVAYGQSKTANILFTVSLNQHLAKHGIYSFALHPGIVMSEGGKPLLDTLPENVLKVFNTFKSIDQGASTTMVAAFDPKLKPEDGMFLSDCQLISPSAWAVDERSAQRLWQLSQDLTGSHHLFHVLKGIKMVDAETGSDL